MIEKCLLNDLALFWIKQTVQTIHIHSTHQIKVHSSLYLINTSTRLRESVYTTALVVVGLVPLNIYIQALSSKKGRGEGVL